VTVGPERHPFLVRAGPDVAPRWLELDERPTESERVFSDRIELTVVGDYHRGDEVTGRITLGLLNPIRARAVRLLLRTTRTTPYSLVPATLLEREAVLRGSAWEGHLRALGFTVRNLLHLVDDASELIVLPRGVTRWEFKFELDRQHPVRDGSDASVVSELVAYAEIPGAPDYLHARALLHVFQPSEGRE
jgi:hypothetical protein